MERVGILEFVGVRGFASTGDGFEFRWVGFCLNRVVKSGGYPDFTCLGEAGVGPDDFLVGAENVDKGGGKNRASFGNDVKPPSSYR